MSKFELEIKIKDEICNKHSPLFIQLIAWKIQELNVTAEACNFASCSLEMFSARGWVKLRA
jgi:hypothetical protein